MFEAKFSDESPFTKGLLVCYDILKGILMLEVFNSVYALTMNKSDNT